MLSNKDQKMLLESQLMIAESLKGIQENLKKLNDSNILHEQKTDEMYSQIATDHKTIIETLKVMTDKYWWLILVLIGVVLSISGFVNLSKIFIQ